MMNNKDIIKLLESDELLTEAIIASSTSSYFHYVEKSRITKHLYKQFWSFHGHLRSSKFRVLRDYLNRKIKMKIDERYLHPDTTAICVTMYILLRIVSEKYVITREGYNSYYKLNESLVANKIAVLVNNVSESKYGNGMWWCSKFANELKERFKFSEQLVLKHIEQPLT